MTSIGLTSISFRQPTSPRRRTPPFRQTSSATSPVSSGEPAPKGKARNLDFVELQTYRKIVFYPKNCVLYFLINFYNAKKVAKTI